MGAKIKLSVILLLVTACEKEPKFKVGQEHEGGIIFYVDSSGEHGLIAAKVDQGKAEWGCQTVKISGADGAFIGAGKQNTLDIINGCPANQTAARLCSDLVLAGYDDWFLPSKDELHQLYLRKDLVGNFVDDGYAPYWSSTEYEIHDSAWRELFGYSEQTIYDKYNFYNVRAIRRF
jgi:hypothetical protein